MVKAQELYEQGQLSQQEILDYNFRHSGRKISKVDFFRVLVPAYTRSMTPKNIQSGYEHTGIYPVNPFSTKTTENLAQFDK